MRSSAVGALAGADGGGGRETTGASSVISTSSSVLPSSISASDGSRSLPRGALHGLELHHIGTWNVFGQAVSIFHQRGLGRHVEVTFFSYRAVGAEYSPQHLPKIDYFTKLLREKIVSH